MNKRLTLRAFNYSFCVTAHDLELCRMPNVLTRRKFDRHVPAADYYSDADFQSGDAQYR